jgi:hypothetical protein
VGHRLVGLAIVVVLSGCGGTTTHDASQGEGEPAPPSPTSTSRTAKGLRFSKLVAGRDHYCGLQLDGALACVKGDSIELERKGPFLDLDLHEDQAPGFRELCTIDAAGALACDLFTNVPRGVFTQVKIGFFNPCALAQGGSVNCWGDPVLGASPAPDIQDAQELAVEMYGGCVRDALTQIRCFGNMPVQTGELRLLNIAASFEHICGQVFAPEDTRGVACIGSEGRVTHLDGFFTSLDVDIDGRGCASNGQQLQCWGGLVPPSSAVPLDRVSVSAGMVCALDAEGAAHCLAQ